MAKEKVVIENLDERIAVRSVYKSAHCRPVKNGKGFYVFYTDNKKNEHVLSVSLIGRGDAWRVAAETIGAKMVKKLEQ